MYNKGDTIELKDGSLALVLDDRLDGKEFLLKYRGKTVFLYSFCYNNTMLEPLIYELLIQKKHIKKHWVFYRLMIGDCKAWLTERDLETIMLK